MKKSGKSFYLTCPVCGKYGFKNKKNYEICPLCGWENDGFYESGGANSLSLEEFRCRYKDCIGENPDFVWENDGYPGENKD